MDLIREIENKILRLKAQKQQAETRMAKILLKKIQTLLGQDFDLNLATGIIEENWNKTSDQDKERWRQKARTFQNGTRTKTLPEDHNKIEATHEPKTNN